MKKGKIIALIVAGVLVIAGIFLVVMGLSLAKSKPKERTLNQQEILIQESFESIQINTKDCDVSVLPHEGTACVTIREMDGVNHSVLVEAGVLKIQMNDQRKWTDYVGIFHVFDNWESMKMTVYLPAAEYASVQVRTETGDITLGQEPFFAAMTLRSETGDISCVGVMGDVLDCMTSTGDISVQNSAPNRTKLHSDTGDLHVQGVAGDEIHLKTNTGEVIGKKSSARMVTCSSDTGDVELEGVLVEDYLQIFTNTGEVGIENCDAGREH